MVDPKDSTPAYQQVANGLRAEIEEGKILPGESLPTEKDLAAAWDVGIDTIKDALAVLREEGLITTRRGYRATVREEPPREVLTVGLDAEIMFRRATRDDREKLGLNPGDGVVEIGGRLYPAYQYTIRYGDGAAEVGAED